MTKILSRGTDIDMEKCRRQAGNNQFDLVIVAAQRMRELKARAKDEGKGVYITAVDALYDVENGLVKLTDYTQKIK
jgi:DNA-directed RNA polymerase subunit K/omega